MRDGATDSVAAVARLVRERNEVDGEIARITNRPVLTGQLGEWLASQLFDIELEPSSSSEAFDGRFTSGPLAARTVDIRWLGTRAGSLDLTLQGPDFWLVFTGPQALALTARGVVRPLRIDACHLFDARQLPARQVLRGAQAGTHGGVLAAEWEAAEVFPRANNPLLAVEPEAHTLLSLFAA